MSDAPPEPDLFSYLDYRAFLRDWFEARKRANPRYSHRVFMRLAGFKSSSVLVHVMRGERNLSPDSVEAVAGALKLGGEARDYFRALVALAQARTDEERNEAWVSLSTQRRFRRARRLDGETFRFLSHWYYPAIHQLASCVGFRADPEWIARRLRPRITPAQAAQALEALEALGLLVDDGEGGLCAREADVVTPPEVANLAVCNYHREMSQRAQDAVAAFEPEERHMLGLTVAVPESLLPAIKQELNRMQARLLDLCDGAVAPAERVYQINLHFVPLSDGSEVTP